MQNYRPTPEELERIEREYTYHAPKAGQAEKYSLLRGLFRDLATKLLIQCPPSRERSVALTKLEEAVFWANAAIARNE